jgi:tRNA U34 5-methylaminomethyl-2-thiouridine-forming methyltransferase MnmC
MSKRQEKIQESIERQREFISARRQQQLFMLEQAYEVGLNIYETNKDKLSFEEVEKIEAMKAEQIAAIEKLKLEAYPSAQT